MLDTTPDAALVQLRAIQRRSPAERVELAVEMSLTVRELLRARLRAEHPGHSEAQLDRELLQLLYPGTEFPPASE